MIHQWIERVCSHAGWEVPGKNSEDKYRFRIEPDIIVDASSPDDRVLVLEATVATFTRFDRDSMIKKAATAVLPRVFKDTSTLSIEKATNSLCLHNVVSLGVLRASEFPEVMENFINGLVFYKSL